MQRIYLKMMLIAATGVVSYAAAENPPYHHPTLSSNGTVYLRYPAQRTLAPPGPIHTKDAISSCPSLFWRIPIEEGISSHASDVSPHASESNLLPMNMETLTVPTTLVQLASIQEEQGNLYGAAQTLKTLIPILKEQVDAGKKELVATYITVMERLHDIYCATRNYPAAIALCEKGIQACKNYCADQPECHHLFCVRYHYTLLLDGNVSLAGALNYALIVSRMQMVRTPQVKYFLHCAYQVQAQISERRGKLHESIGELKVARTYGSQVPRQVDPPQREGLANQIASLQKQVATANPSSTHEHVLTLPTFQFSHSLGLSLPEKPQHKSDRSYALGAIQQPAHQQVPTFASSNSQSSSWARTSFSRSDNQQQHQTRWGTAYPLRENSKGDGYWDSESSSSSGNSHLKVPMKLPNLDGHLSSWSSTPSLPGTHDEPSLGRASSQYKQDLSWQEYVRQGEEAMRNGDYVQARMDLLLALSMVKQYRTLYFNGTWSPDGAALCAQLCIALSKVYHKLHAPKAALDCMKGAHLLYEKGLLGKTLAMDTLHHYYLCCYLYNKTTPFMLLHHYQSLLLHEAQCKNPCCTMHSRMCQLQGALVYSQGGTMCESLAFFDQARHDLPPAGDRETFEEEHMLLLASIRNKQCSDGQII